MGIWISILPGYHRVQQNIDAVDTVFLDWWQVSPGGGLHVHDAPAWAPHPAYAAYFRSHCVQSYGAVATDSPERIGEITGPARSAFVANLVAAAQSSGVDGIHLAVLSCDGKSVRSKLALLP